MASTITPHIRALPLYQYAQREGQDIGLVIALTAITREVAAQDNAAIAAALDEPHGPSAAAHEHTAGRLHAVARIVGAAFRTRP